VRRYASGTKVPVEKTRGEIEKLVKTNGASQFAYYDDDTKAVIQFVSHDRMLRFTLPLPGALFGVGPRGGNEARREQEIKERWRALLLAIKAKYEAIRSGITEFEAEFLAHVVVGGNQTVADVVRPRVAEMYKGGKPSGVLNLEFNKV
jgi:hypothetical protein